MSFTLANAVTQTRRHLKDTTENVWTTTDIKAFVNDAILAIRSTIPEYFTTLVKVANDNDVIYIDENYELLIPLFCAARCFEQDEQHFRATQKMNEFESRRIDMEQQIRNSDEYVEKTSATDSNDYVKNIYTTDYDDDEEIIGLL